MIEFTRIEESNKLDHYNDEFLGSREEIYIDLGGLKRVEIETTISKKISTTLGNLIGRINPNGVPPHFMTVVASERPAVLAEVKEDMLPSFAAADRQGILWTRNVFIINGQKVAQSGHDGSSDNILPANIMGPDVISFGYIFDGTDWDRIRSVVDNADNLAVGNPGHVATMAKLLGFDGSTYDRLRVGATDADNVATLATGVLQTGAYNFGFDGTTWDRFTVGQYNADSLAPAAAGGQIVNAVMRVYDANGSTLNLVRGTVNDTDGIAVSTTVTKPSVVSTLQTFNGTSLDRVRSRTNASDAIATNSTGNVQVLSYNLGFNGTTFDRIRAGSNAADAIATVATGNLHALNFNMGFNGATFDRIRSGSNAADAIATVTTGNQHTLNYNLGFNGTTFDRLRSGGNNADAIATNTLGILFTKSHGAVSNGSTFDIIKSASATNQNTAASTTLAGIPLSTQPGNWSVSSFPAVNNQATASRAAGGAGVRHILTSLHFSIAAGATASGIVQCQIRDGGTGAGTIIWSGALAVPIGDSREISLSGLSLVGTANTAMTIEFSAAGGATTQESVSMTGYSVV